MKAMLQQLELTSLSQRCKFLKLTTMYNALYIFPPVTLYKLIPVVMAVLIPFARTNLSFVPSVISLWNNLPDSVKTSSISVFKAHIPH